MFQFAHKTIFLISHERWGVMKISKHHYALELANRGCLVYFIEPPELSETGVRIVPAVEHQNINIVKYHPFFRGKRFLPPFLFSGLIRVQISRLLKAIGRKPDVVWCFHGFLFEDLSVFGAPVNIFFAADYFSGNTFPPELKSAQLILAVSETIQKKISSAGYRVFRINHGLQKAFVDKALEKLNSGIPSKSSEKITVGYAGNLRIEIIDRKSMLEVIKSFPDFTFIFWGSYESNNLNLYGLTDQETDEFLMELASLPNVLLRGPIDSESLQKEMHETSMFWICWHFKGNVHRDNSNSHKLMEYFSTGSPIISHEVLNYKDSDLLYMLPKGTQEAYSDFFKRIVHAILEGEQDVLFKKRISFALDNTYGRQVDRIESMLN